MTKNLSKIGSLIFVVAVVVVLLISGNPNAPPIIEEGNLKLMTDKYIKTSTIELYTKGIQILSFSPEVMLIAYNNKTMPIFAYSGIGYSNMEAMFNGNDSKNVEIKGNTMIITYFNNNKDPNKASIIFTLENSTLFYNIIVNASHPENLGQFWWRASTEKYKTIITPSDENIDNEAGKDSGWSKSIQIPESDKNYELLISNDTMLNISGNFTRIGYIIKNKGAIHYLNYSEGLNIKVQEPVELNLTQKYPITISTSSTISDGIRIYKNGTQILSLSPWEAIFKHDGRTQRLISSKKYDEDNPNKVIFNYNNSEKLIKISNFSINGMNGYEMNVSWVNESKEVREVGFNIKIYENKSYAEIKYIYRTKNAYVSLEPLSYGISFDKDKFKYIKILRDSKIKGNIQRNVIENEKKGYLNFEECEKEKCDKIIAEQWFMDKGKYAFPEKVVEIEGNFSRISHYFTYNLVRLYKSNFKESLKIYVE